MENNSDQVKQDINPSHSTIADRKDRSLKAALPKRETFHARVSAKPIVALAPLMREVFELAHSDTAFFNQMPTHRFGAYILPVEKGVVIAVHDHARFVAIHDPEGQAEYPFKVHFPDGLLDVLQPRMIALADENGMRYEIEAQPAPTWVMCTDGFGIVFGKNGEKDKEGACFGTWFNDDSGNIIRLGSWRLEKTDATSIQTMLASVFASPRQPTTEIDLNLYNIAGICHAAKVLNTTVRLGFAGNGAIQIQSINNELLFALVMPLQSEGVDVAAHSTRNALEAFAALASKPDTASSEASALHSDDPS